MRTGELDYPNSLAWIQTKKHGTTYPTSWNPTTNTSVTISSLFGVFGVTRTFFVQEINTADWLLDLQALGHLARFYIPESNRLIVGATDQAFAFQE